MHALSRMIALRDAWQQSSSPAAWRPLALLGLLALLIGLQVPGVDRLQEAGFDAFQALSPREVQSLPATIVAIDEPSLLALGQWPWPRTTLARLVDMVDRAGPAVVGVAVLMPEPDALSPNRWLARAAPLDDAVAEALRALPSNDAVLARALAASRTVLAVAGVLEPTGKVLRVAPIFVRTASGGAVDALQLTRYAGVLTSIPELGLSAAGAGLVSADTTRGVLRRMLLLADIDGTILPAFVPEMLRVATGAPGHQLTVAGSAAVALTVGGLTVPTEPDGAVRIHYSLPRQDRFVSAVDVLEGRSDPALLRGQFVFIGVTAVGLEQVYETPVGQRMSGVEIHAQLIENLLHGTLLYRARWAPAAEALWLLMLGGVLVAMVPRYKLTNAALLLLAFVALPVGAAFAAYRTQGWLLDAVTPGLSLLLLFGALMASALSQSVQQRRALDQLVQAQREASARIEGELSAAQRFQRGILPRADLLLGDRRVDLQATLMPAREVGGDLYDYFMLDEDRLFVLVGDVAGKGLSASIFMAVGKALYKNAMLRMPEADIGEVMREANAAVMRDNSEMLFITAFAAILNLESGVLSYCNAGHESPWRLLAGGARPERLTGDGGPPLCVLEDFEYRSAQCPMAPGDGLCLVTDGVTEADGAAGGLYGADRAEQVLAAANRDSADARELLDALQQDVQRFAANTGIDARTAGDDLTILVLRWHGPARTLPGSD